MLRKQHLALSFFIILPLVFALLLSKIGVIVFLAVFFFFCVMAGTLLPDLDSALGMGLAKNNKFIFIVTQLLYPVTGMFFEYLSFRVDWKHDIRFKHRGIMHSPIGIIASSFILTLIIFIPTFLLVLTPLLTWTAYVFPLVIFLGLIFGQFLHLIEDSCTVSGINWKFPFGTRTIKGKISTGADYFRPYLLIFFCFLIAIGSIWIMINLMLPFFIYVMALLCLMVLEILFVLFFSGARF